jgi:nitrous oxidase accessory protein NosD
MRVKMTVAVAALVALLLGLPASSYAHRTIEVKSGESIQAAIDKAKPYTTIEVDKGTYQETLSINKDGIKLVGEGRKQTHITAPADPDQAGCGICVGSFENPDARVKDVSISHLSVDGFGINVVFVGSKNGSLIRTILSDYHEYGVFANSSTGTTIARNVTYNSVDGVNPEAGIYVGDSPQADATVWKNVSWGNELGIFLRDAAHGVVIKNKSFSNCVGMLFLNTDEPTDPADWLAKHNNVTANNRQCAPNEEAPPLSGVGIAVIGGHDIDLIDNGVFGNKATADFQSAFAGGILVTGSPFVTPPVSSTGIKVGLNTAFGNSTDLVLDEGNEAKFFANDCLTSQPDGLCEDPDDNGDNGDGDHGDDGHKGGDRDHADNHKKDSKKHKSGKHKKHKKHKKSKKHDD